MNGSRELYIRDDGIRIHAKLDLPKGIDTRLFPAEPGKTTGVGISGADENTEAVKKPGIDGNDGNTGIDNDYGSEGPDGRIPLMILVHGFTGHMEETHILAAGRAANEAGFAVLRAEMYGHGKSDGEFSGHTLMKWIGNVTAVIDYARTLDFVSDLYMCGHSQGGLLTMLVGAMQQDRLRALVELSPASMIPADARRGEVLGTYFDPDNIPEFLTSEDSWTLSGNYVRAAQMIDVDYAIAKYKGPVLIVHGTGDKTVPCHYSVEIAKKYADARLVTIPGDTHCYDYHLDMVEEAVRAFLCEISK